MHPSCFCPSIKITHAMSGAMPMEVLQLQTQNKKGGSEGRQTDG
jgi:hypothetical protein